MTSGVLSTFFLTPGSAGSTVIGYAAPGAGSNMWLLDFQSGIARLSEQGTLTRFEPNSDAYTSPPTIAVGSDGNAWFTDFVQHQIGRLTPTGTLTTFPVAGDLESITSGSDGNLWFTGVATSSGTGVGRITPAGVISAFTLPGGPPAWITSGPDGNLWITQGNLIGRLTPNGLLTEFPIPKVPVPLADSFLIVAGSDGNVWFTQPGAHRIGRITPAGTITQFDLGLMRPITMAAGSDGNMWFTANGIDPNVAPGRYTFMVGRLSPDGTLSKYNSFPDVENTGLIASGPDHALWIFGPSETFRAGTPQNPAVVRLDPTAVGEPDSIVHLSSTTTSPQGTGSTLTAGAPEIPPPRKDNKGGIVVSQISPMQTNVNPNVSFVGQVYHDLLKRQPEAAGLAGWVDQLDHGASRTTVVQQIQNSPEYRTDAVENAYASLLGRGADSPGLQAFLGFLDTGGTFEQVEMLMLGSSEYFARRGAGTASAFLAALYNDVLHRPLDVDGAASWGRLLKGPMGESIPGRGLVALSVLQGDEALREQGEMLYQTLLHRTADKSGLESFVAVLKHGSSREQEIATLVASEEYFQRFRP